MLIGMQARLNIGAAWRLACPVECVPDQLMRRAGRNLSKRQKAPLEKAKNKLRKLFGKAEK